MYMHFKSDCHIHVKDHVTNVYILSNNKIVTLSFEAYFSPIVYILTGLISWFTFFVCLYIWFPKISVKTLKRYRVYYFNGNKGQLNIRSISMVFNTNKIYVKFYIFISNRISLNCFPYCIKCFVTLMSRHHGPHNFTMKIFSCWKVDILKWGQNIIKWSTFRDDSTKIPDCLAALIFLLKMHHLKVKIN
jgi:hypothetical protein